MHTVESETNRPSKGDVVFRSGDVRSTLDDQLMEKAGSSIRSSSREGQGTVLERQSSNKRGIDERDASLLPGSWWKADREFLPPFVPTSKMLTCGQLEQGLT